MIRLQNWGDRMYLSRVELDITRRTTMQALAAPQKLHGAVESSFPGERKRRLWRLDRLGGKLYLLVLSEDQPDLTELVRQFGRQEAAPEIQDYTPLLKRISPGSVWRFRLTANPTKSCPGKKDSDIRGTVKAHCSVEFQKQWLLDRAPKHGFSLLPDKFTVTESKWLHFSKGRDSGRPVTILSVTYEGILRITDEQQFCQLLKNGIGRGKAYGLGLMTVMRQSDLSR